MEVTNAVEVTVECNEDELLVDLELLSDAELAKIGGGQAIIFL